MGFRILWAVFRIPKLRIPDSTCKFFPDSGIWIPLHGAAKRATVHKKGFVGGRANSVVSERFSYIIFFFRQISVNFRLPLALTWFYNMTILLSVEWRPSPVISAVGLDERCSPLTFNNFTNELWLSWKTLRDDSVKNLAAGGTLREEDPRRRNNFTLGLRGGILVRVVPKSNIKGF